MRHCTLIEYAWQPSETMTPQLLTPGRIAERLRVPLHRVLYIIRTRAHIREAARAGTLRLFNERTVAMIRHELNAIDARRGNRLAADQPAPDRCA